VTTFEEWRQEGGSTTADLSIPESARAFQGERAGFATRVIACAIDVALVAVLMTGVWVALWLVQAILTPGVDVEPPRAATLVVWGYFFMTAYWAITWSTSGRSLGAWVLGVRVVSPRGERLRFPYALLRAAFCVGFPFGLLWALVSKRNRSVQDVVLRTIVIYDWALRPPVILAAWRQS
jgi:uncharacterized RDD family membrane protein YckC